MSKKAQFMFCWGEWKILWKNIDTCLQSISLISSDSHSSSPFNTKTIIAKDCVNGTYMPKGLIRETATNYTEINRVFLSHGHRHMLDPQMLNIPYDQSITIYDKTKVKILKKISKP